MLCCLPPAPGPARAAEAGLSWPPITREHRPWAYWWWMGSAVDKTNLTRELTRYRDAGYGGAHIIPIYGAKGWEDKYISYLSPQWMEMMSHAVAEARRMGMDVDMTTGTGWCFGGGPYVGDQEGNALVVNRTLDLAGGAKLTEKFDRTQIHAIVAFPQAGKPVELTGKLRADGSVNWTAPAGGARVHVVSQRPSPQKVKRASPGGEGPMLNLIYPAAMPVFLRSHTEAFDAFKGPKPRAQYHDSYEYRSEWSPDFFKSFEKRRGYRLQTELPALFSVERGRRRDDSGTGSQSSRPAADPDRVARVLTDYRETVSDVMIEESLPQWVKWSHQRGFLTRNEAHGSPGNLLDLYALTDVPETEMFRLDRNKLVSKLASSAAHVAGRKLTSCETGTWLKEHFTETLADMKYLLDDLFVSGVNHVFYHGTCYSPDEAGWPGWVFYASYQMNPRNSIWRDAPAINAYIARSQAILQSGQPDNDVLLYWPIHDFWHKAGPETLLPHLTIHARGWFEGQPISRAAEQLWHRGYAFDYVSDRQLAQASVTAEGIRLPGGTYRTVVVPPCDVIPLATMEKLLALARSGATIIFQDHLPKDVPGWGRLEQRRAQFQKWVAQAKGATRGKGRVLVGDLEANLKTAGVAREEMVDHAGLFYVRRSFDGGQHYFIANRSEQAVDGWLPFNSVAQFVALLDPMTGQTGAATFRPRAGGGTEVYLQLQPGESVVVRGLSVPPADRAQLWRWDHWQPVASAQELRGEWQVDFVAGGPELPATTTTGQLSSWTNFPGDQTKRFAGTARYSIRFDAPTEGRAYWLDLGRVVQSARVRLNGRDCGTLLTAPFRVVLHGVKPTGNLLEVEVTNVSANRIRDLDRQGVKWQNFHDINFVNQDYRPFNAADWPLAESGLLGPVTLAPIERLNPAEARR